VRMAVPLLLVSEVVLVGGVGATTPAMLSLLDHGTGLSLISKSSRLRGRLIAAEARNLPLRHKQYACSSNARFCLRVGQSVVIGKLKNYRTMARRILRKGGRAGSDQGGNLAPPICDAGLHLERINAALARAPATQYLAELRGLEGMGSKAYFAILRNALCGRLTFEARTRRPPKDPANALLSLAYALLTNALFTACEVAGLDLYDGFFHANKYGRPALALDLVEEFRPIVAESVVSMTVNKWHRRVRASRWVVHVVSMLAY